MSDDVKEKSLVACRQCGARTPRIVPSSSLRSPAAWQPAGNPVTKPHLQVIPTLDRAGAEKQMGSVPT